MATISDQKRAAFTAALKLLDLAQQHLTYPGTVSQATSEWARSCALVAREFIHLGEAMSQS